jgi:cardiolipin synthase A/B
MAERPEDFSTGNAVRLLDDGAEALPAMLSAIEGAERQVCLEMYWFASDQTGRAFADRLGRKAEAGVEVNVLYDAVGSFESDESMFDEMRRRGVRVIQYHPLAPWRTRFAWSWLTWNRRDHRKVLVVDGRVGFTGGLNLCDQSAPVEQGGQGWRDAMVEIEGSVGHRLGHLFGAAWRAAGGPPLREPPGAPVVHEDAPDAVLGARLLFSGPGGRHRLIRHHYLYRIYAAERSIHVTNAYFVPDRVVVQALVRAAKRGVDVRIVLPAVSDVPLARFAARSRYERLIEGGVHVHEYESRVLHSKTAVIDGRWSTVGSYNLDYRSWKLNLEVNAVVADERFGAQMEDRFVLDLAHAPEVDLAAFRRRPLRERLLERLARAVRVWL